MARIRTIKPEFFTSEQIMELRPLTRLLFIGIWPFCDDHGVHSASLKTLKAEIFPSDDITIADLADMMDELIIRRLVVEYSSNDRNYWHVTGWSTHQKIDKPSYKHPFPYEQNQVVKDHSSNDRRMVVERSTTESNGMESNGMEGSRSKTTTVLTQLGLKNQNQEPSSLKMSLFEFRSGYQEATGELLKGGNNETAAEACRHYARSDIEEAFRITALQGGRTLKYVLTVLKGDPKPPGILPRSSPKSYADQWRETAEKEMKSFIYGGDNDTDNGQSGSEIPVCSRDAPALQIAHAAG